ncbi:hypothetical protein MAMT_00434 [Methylacidimicrobium tartarophylax]|uniref:Uncharacterized protein n=2 Tax=Methylacidimicrobium tartarophylax TaxID=1041768 RepID=A0A5E6MG62_9BACT|nr:hypothetical protein MAMT_00434 [Methylacidimicrobium tartarophylax]
MRAVVFPERKEGEFSERSNLQPMIQPAKGEGTSRAIRPPSGRGAPGRPIEAGLPAFAVALSLLALFSLSVLSWWKEQKQPAPPAAAPRTDWAGPILAPLRALQPQDAESCFVAYYRELAQERNRWIDSFVLQRAQIEEQKGKSRLHR